MAAVAIHQFAQCITCHAWSPDQSSNSLFILSLLHFLVSCSSGSANGFLNWERGCCRISACFAGKAPYWAILLATTSTDGKCRVFSTFIKGVDSRSFVKFLDEKKIAPSSSKYGSQVVLYIMPLRYPLLHLSGLLLKKVMLIHIHCDFSCIVPLRKPGDTIVRRFSTSGWKL
ncbi:hypothetical protein BHM03_00001503 [Ensete ventricosum]|uniref:Uncharacterized protein n=1 Tax=Ensete ventricosum TaxID=4639 RepID=A0A445M960_ENSVE|nr:hypothetical protein BHM03_00001503 [Ensete ventricosum]